MMPSWKGIKSKAKAKLGLPASYSSNGGNSTSTQTAITIGGRKSAETRVFPIQETKVPSELAQDKTLASTGGSISVETPLLPESKFQAAVIPTRQQSETAQNLDTDEQVGSPQPIGNESLEMEPEASTSVDAAITTASCDFLPAPKSQVITKATPFQNVKIDSKPSVANPRQADALKGGHSRTSDSLGSQPLSLLPDLWEAAMGKLSEKDRAKLVTYIKQTEEKEDSPTKQDSALSAIQSIQDHASRILEEEKSKKWKSAINKLLDGTQKFKSLVDSGMKFDTSGYGAIAWSALSFGLQIALNAKELRQFVFESSELIAQLLARYSAYELLYRGSKQNSKVSEMFEDRVVELYKGILIYMLSLEVYLEENGIVHHTKAFIPASERTISSQKKDIDKVDNEIKDLLYILKAESDNESFSRIENQIKDIVQPVYQLDKRLESIQRFNHRAERQEVLSWLPDAQQETVHSDIRNKPKIKDPGIWILETQQYQEWENSRVSCGLWLHGALGTGKTILTSTVITQIDILYGGTSQGAMAYFYCSGTANAKTKASEILGNILRQLIATDAGLDVFKMWQERHRPRDLTIVAMGELLLDIIELNDQSQTTIIIDALDEADADSFFDVVEILEQLINDSPGLVKVFISSRPEDHINGALEAWPGLEIEPQLTRKDIETYIDSQVNKRLLLKRRVKDELRQDVKDFLKVRANGMFRYVEMAVRWICGPDNPYEIEDAMRTIPKDLLGVYRELFDRINNNRPLKKELARRTISWLIAAKNQLRADELIKALSSGYAEYHANVTVEDIISSCHHLAVYNKSLEIVEFGHFSVVEFIRDEKKDEYSQEKVHDITAFLCLNAMWEVGRVEVQGLQQEIIREYVSSLIGSFVATEQRNESSPSEEHESPHKTYVTFWYYAINLWAFHCQSSGSDSPVPKMWDSPLRLWREIRQRIHGIPFTEPSSVSLGINSIRHRIPEHSARIFDEWLFMISCAFGLYGTAKQLIHDNRDLLNFKSVTTGVCGIHWAAKWGNLNTLNLLLEPSATVDLQDNAAWTPLAYAICGKHIDVVKFLLSRHANPRAHSSGGKSLYQLATEEKFDEGAAALVGAGVVEPDSKRSEIRPGQIQDQNRSGSRIYDTQHAKYHNKDEVPFVAQRRLGAGGFATVDLVRARDSELVLALKTFRITKRDRKMQSRYCDNEVAIMQRLVHPHIVKVVSTFETYVENVPKAFGILIVPVGEEDLHHFMERMGQSGPTPDDIRRLEGWMMCLATAVAYMHSRYIQHRDIKPQNVICKDDKLYFIDFHSSIDRSDSEYDYDSDGWEDVPHTVRWTAPEVQNGERVGFPADIFSLGALFSQMNTLISRRSLKDFENFREQASPYHPEERFGAFHSSIGKVETWLGRKQVASNKLIIRMMSRKPQDRPTAFEVVSALRSINGFPNCDCVLQVSPP